MVYVGTAGIYTVYEPNKVESPSEVKSVEPIQTSIDEKKLLVKEKWYFIAFQVAVPFFIAGVGTIGAGIVLGNVTEYKVFREVNALLILVPALLGLKGNLDMCLASRLSTQANLGNMKSKKELFKMITGNIVLVQIQAIVASCIVAVFAVSASALINGNFSWKHALLLATSSVLTATMTCFFLDIILVALIILSNKIKLNPDNLATPMAASIGDVVSLLVLSSWASLLFRSCLDTYTWVMGVILACYICILLPIWILIVRKNHYTQKILSNGWTPVLTALVISGSGGLVLDSAVDKFRGYEVFQPIVNGIGGNLVSVQASRISTMLHKTSVKGIIPNITKQWVAPWTALFAGVLPAKTARILIVMSVLGHTLFVFAADYIYNGVVTVTAVFVTTYLAVGIIQLMILLYIAHIMIHLMWILKIDPDSSAIPYLTALGDLLGSSLLLLAFMFLRSINKEYEPV